MRSNRRFPPITAKAASSRTLRHCTFAPETPVKNEPLFSRRLALEMRSEVGPAGTLSGRSAWTEPPLIRRSERRTAIPTAVGPTASFTTISTLLNTEAPPPPLGPLISTPAENGTVEQRHPYAIESKTCFDLSAVGSACADRDLEHRTVDHYDLGVLDGDGRADVILNADSDILSCDADAAVSNLDV